jgi:hypothetical protein
MKIEDYEAYIEKAIADYDEITASAKLISKLANRSYELSFDYDMDEEEIKAELMDVLPATQQDVDEWSSLLDDLADEIVSNFADDIDKSENEDEE